MPNKRRKRRIRSAAPVKKANSKPKEQKKRVRKKDTPEPPEDYPYFRRYKVSSHPALITAEHSEDEYDFRKVTHSERDGRHPNERVFPNPNPADPNPMYIVKRTRHDKKNRFGERYPWIYPEPPKK